MLTSGVRRAHAVRALALLIACGDRDRPPEPASPAPAVDPDELTAAERAQLAELSPRPPLPADPTNRFAGSAAAARLGQRLFFDPALSGPLRIASELGAIGDRGKVACHTCHDGPVLDDRRPPPDHVSLGTGRGTRNSPPLVDAAAYRWSNWAGRFDSQWSLVLAVIEKPEVMNGSRVDVARRLVEHYRADYEAAFGPLPAALDGKRFPAGARPPDPAWSKMTAADRAVVDELFVHAGKAIAAYLRLLVGGGAPFDRFAAGHADAIDRAAKRGFRLFLAHCKVCHGGPYFTDGAFHALAVAQFGPDVPKLDGGRADDVPPLLASPFNSDGAWSDDRTTGRLAGLVAPTARGEFRTPTLRNVAITAPYMHAGQLRTLANVVAFYNAGGGEVEGIRKAPELARLRLSEQQQADLVAFMQTLTDEPLPAALTAPP